MKCLHRPASIWSDPFLLDQEYKNARWTYHRLLDFEFQHQDLIDKTAEEIAPGILAVGRILARLKKRNKWAERATKSDKSWLPKPRPALEEALKERLATLRAKRNKDPRWKKALRWADESDEEAPQKGKARRRRAKDPSKIVRKKTETEEQYHARLERLTRDETEEEFEVRKAKRNNKMSRREMYRNKLYAERKIYWGTWNALIASVDQSRKDVLKRRKQGLPAEWNRPKWDEPLTLVATAGGFKIINKTNKWWSFQMRLLEGWVDFNAKAGTWHRLTGEEKIKECKLTRRKTAAGWRYSVSLAIENAPENREGFSDTGTVALDWGHREHGHQNAAKGIRVFYWKGDDGDEGEILLPKECRDLQDRVDQNISYLDTAYNARKKTLKLPHKNRHTYGRHLRKIVRSREESLWVDWEIKHQQRIERMRRRIDSLRKETYLQAIRSLRKRYKTFVVEDEKSESHKKHDIARMVPRRKRQNREMSARYKFLEMCERLGATIHKVPSRNSTRECPDCGHLDENGPDLIMVCAGCGRARDKDEGADRILAKRAKETLVTAAE